MDFLKKLFSGGAGGSSGDKNGIYFYIKPNGCQEIVKVRVDVNNEPSLDDDGKGYFVRKNARGTTYKCTRSAELYLTFDSNHKLLNTEVTGGTLVDEAAYLEWMAAQESSGQ